MGIMSKLYTSLGLVTKEQLSDIEIERNVERETYEQLLAQKDDKLLMETDISGAGFEDTEKSLISKNSSIRKTPKQCLNLYLTNQFISRGVNVKADEMMARGYTLVNGDKRGVTLCRNLMKESGDTNFLRTLIINTDITGDGFVEKVRNKAQNKIMVLRNIHPVNFGFETDLDGKILLNVRKEPRAYQQLVSGTNTSEDKKIIPKESIEHLRFNMVGDEFNGISTLQSVYNTAVRLMNMEQSAAVAAVRTANPLYIAHTDTKNINEIRKWAKFLGNISGASKLVIPKNMEITMMSPGQQNFNAYADYFLDAVVAALGVPRALLLGESRSGSRAQGVILSRHFYSIIRAQQRYVEDFMNNIFEVYGEIAGFVPPIFKFNDVAEDAAVNGQRAIELFQNKLISQEEARIMIGLELGSGQSVEGAVKTEDKKNWHPSEGTSPAGSQKGVKQTQKINPDVPSVPK